MAFQPGQSGNPLGRTKRPKLFTNSLIAALKRTDENDIEAIQRIADKLVNLAESGDVQAIKEIADRVEGKVPQGIGGDDDLPDMRMRLTWISSSHTSPETSSSGTTTASADGPAS